MACGARFPVGTERLNDNTFVYYPHLVGHNVLICGRKNSRFPMQCFVGPEWPCMFVTIALIIVPTYFFVKNVGSVLGKAVSALAIVLCILTVGFYLFTACSDPGIIYVEVDSEKKSLVEATKDDSDIEMQSSGDEKPEGTSSENDGNHENIFDRDDSGLREKKNKPSTATTTHTHSDYIDCSLCQMKRPRSAHHCHECKLCIDELDHHCPWTGKCIGKKNLTFFHNFLISLSTLICFVIIAVIVAAAKHLPLLP